MSDLDSWWIHTVAVETFLGSGAYGDKFADAAPALVNVEDVTKLVRDSSGSEVVSSTTVRGDLTLTPMFALGSLVTDSSGHEARVISLSRFQDPDLGMDHFEASLS